MAAKLEDLLSSRVPQRVPRAAEAFRFARLHSTAHVLWRKIHRLVVCAIKDYERDNFVVCICVLSVCLGTFNQSIPKDPPQRSRPLTMLNVSSSVSASLVLRRSTGTSCIRDNILAAAFLLANFLEVPLPGEITTTEY